MLNKLSPGPEGDAVTAQEPEPVPEINMGNMIRVPNREESVPTVSVDRESRAELPFMFPAAIVEPVMPENPPVSLIQQEEDARRNVYMVTFERLHGRVLPQIPIRDQCFVAYLNGSRTSTVDMDNRTSRATGQTVLLACPASSGTPADYFFGEKSSSQNLW